MSHRSLSQLAALALLGFVFTLGGCSGDNLNAPPPPPAPAPPTNLVVTVMSSSWINLSWNDASTDEDGFAIERCEGTGCSNFTAWRTAPANATGYADISVVGGTSYSYRVRASNSAGMSAFSNTATGVTQPAGPIPAPPTNPVATTVNSSRIQVTWTDASTNEDGFKVERCQGSGCTNFALVSTSVTPNGSAHLSTGLTASTTYRYRIQSYNGSGGSAFTAAVTATTATAVAAPAAPSGLTATAVSSSRINLTWVDNSTDEDEFRVERCQGAGCTNFSWVGSTPGATWADNSRAASTSYSYRVSAANGAGASPYSGTATATTQPAATLPTAPSGLTATATSSSAITLTWIDNSNNEDEFEIERCVGPGCVNFTLLTTRPANSTSYPNGGLSPATSYSYRVRARNGAGTTVFSSPATATTQPNTPAAPSGLTANVVSASRIDLSWTDNSSNEDGFVLQRCSGAGCTNFSSLVSIGMNATTYSNTGLTASTSHSYRILAINANGSSAYSGTATGVTPADLLAPTLNVPSVSGSSIALTWSYTWTGLASSNDGYQLEESTTSSTTGFTAVHSPLTHTTPYSHTLTNRAAGTYYYRVRAITAQGATPYSTVRTATVVATTPAIGVSPTSLSFTAVQAGANPSNKTVAITNTGTGTLSGLTVTEAPLVGWVSASIAPTTAPATMTVQVNIAGLTPGTYTMNLNVAATGASNSPRSVPVTLTITAAAPPSTLRIINDLPGNVVGPNNWGLLNTVVRLRVGPTQSSVVNMSAGAYELLFNGDFTSDVGSTFDINPGQTVTLDVSIMTGAYYLYIQNGWWEYFQPTDTWEKHMTGVVGCDGQTTVYKGAIIQITQPFGNPEEIRLSDWLPIGNYFGSSFCP